MQRPLLTLLAALGLSAASALTVFAVDVYASPAFSVWAGLMRLCM